MTLTNSNQTFGATGTHYLLKSMLANGIDLAPKGCHGGGCGVCKIRILQGTATKLPMNRRHIGQSEEEQGYSLACRTFPTSDIEFEFIGKVMTKKNKYGLY